jgi:hypothetical protein
MTAIMHRSTVTPNIGTTPPDMSRPGMSYEASLYVNAKHSRQGYGVPGRRLPLKCPERETREAGHEFWGDRPRVVSR